MSYDVYVNTPARDACACCGRGAEKGQCVFDVNYTSNMSGVWDEVGITLRDWDKKPVSEVIEALRKGIETIEADRSAWRHREPPNGWGLRMAPQRRDAHEGTGDEAAGPAERVHRGVNTSSAPPV